MNLVSSPVLLSGVHLGDGRPMDVLLDDTVIKAVEAAGTLSGSAAEHVNLSGYLLLPAPAEPHAHLDKAYSADTVANPTGDLAGAVDAWLRHRPAMSRAEIRDRAQRAVEAYVTNGATAIRTHVDIGGPAGLTGLDAITEMRAAVAELCHVQVVAFAANPLTGPAGADNRALLAEALSAGADVVGACPGLDPDPAGCIDVCLSVAAAYGAPVDLHIDESLEAQPCTLALLVAAVRHTEFPYPVTASHCVSLAMMPTDEARRLADDVAAAGISVICLPQTNLYLQGRDHLNSPPRGLTAVHLLRAAGVRVAAGGDNLQDPFNVLGRADPLENAALLVLAGHDRPETAYAAISSVARTVLGLPPVAIRPGAPAELLAIKAASLRQAVAEATADRVIVHSGRVVARTATTRTVVKGDTREPAEL